MLLTRSRAGNEKGFQMEDFCNLPEHPDIAEAINTEERLLAATLQSESIRTTPMFEAFRLPEIDIGRVEAILERDLPALEARTIAQVQGHIATLGPRGEHWVASGMEFISETVREDCPFCAQPLESSTLIQSYRGYFSEGYARLKREIAEMLVVLRTAKWGRRASLFRAKRTCCAGTKAILARVHYNSQPFLDNAAITDTWRRAYEALRRLVEQKQRDPLGSISSVR